MAPGSTPYIKIFNQLVIMKERLVPAGCAASALKALRANASA
jgi:hypothetical protein